jgi:hypothetical protein
MLLLASERAQLQRAAGAAGELPREAAPAPDEVSGEGAAGREGTAGDGVAGLDPYVSCFVTMPAGDPRAAEIYDAARAVLEHAPYYWRVERAADFGQEPGPWPDRRERLLGAHCYLAILGAGTDPGVLIDAGRMQALDRPMLILTGAAAPAPPASLAGIPRAALQSAGGQLSTEVASALGQEPGWQALNGRDRYLSSALLSRDAGLSEQASEQISRHYPTWQGFLDADAVTVAEQAGISRHLVSAVKATLEDLRAAQT